MHKPVQPATHWMQLNIKIDHLHLSRPFHQRLLQIHQISHPQCHQDLFHKTLDCPHFTCPLMMKQWICRVKIQSAVNEVLLKFLGKKKKVLNEQCQFSQTSLSKDSDEYFHLFQNVRLLYDQDSWWRQRWRCIFLDWVRALMTCVSLCCCWASIWARIANAVQCHSLSARGNQVWGDCCSF